MSEGLFIKTGSGLILLFTATNYMREINVNLQFTKEPYLASPLLLTSLQGHPIIYTFSYNSCKNFFTLVPFLFLKYFDNPQVTKSQLKFLAKKTFQHYSSFLLSTFNTLKLLTNFLFVLVKPEILSPPSRSVGTPENIRLLTKTFLLSSPPFWGSGPGGYILWCLFYTLYGLASLLTYTFFVLLITTLLVTPTGPRHSAFSEWLAGLIDGDGCFQLSQAGYASLEITLDIRDKHCLLLIQDKYGGSAEGNTKPALNWLRYRLHNKNGLLSLINDINGLIRNPTRIAQLQKICAKYSVPLSPFYQLVDGLYVNSLSLNYNNGWLAGFIDSDGSIYILFSSDQVFITASQKNKFLLEPLVDLYGGTLEHLKKVDAYKWKVYRKSEVIKLLDYFNIHPLRSAKNNRAKLISEYFSLRKVKAHLATPNSTEGNLWSNFLINWENYSAH